MALTALIISLFSLALTVNAILFYRKEMNGIPKIIDLEVQERRKTINSDSKIAVLHVERDAKFKSTFKRIAESNSNITVVSASSLKNSDSYKLDGIDIVVFGGVYKDTRLGALNEKRVPSVYTKSRTIEAAHITINEIMEKLS